MKEKIKYLVDIHKSIFKDCKSKAKFLYNNWDEHSLGGLLLGGIAAFLLNFLYGDMVVWQKMILTSFATFFVCLSIEWGQQIGRTIEPEERFESYKDLLVGFYPSLITLIVTLLLLK